MKKRSFLLATVLLLSLIGALYRLSRARTFQVFGELHARVETKQKVVALTFDDGPTEKTARILAILDSLNIKATFFVTGKELENHRPEGTKLAAAGHQLGNHTYSHRRMVLKSWAFIKNELERTDSLIRQTGYSGEILFRPPNGKRLFLLPYYLQKNNRKTIMWDVEPESYPDIAQDSEKITEHVLAHTRPGSIILLHVMYGDRAASVKAIRGIVTGLRRQGYAFKTVNELLRYR